MTTDHQYNGFLDTKVLWPEKYEQLPAFDHNIEPKKSTGAIKIQIPKNEVLGKIAEHFFYHYIQSLDHYKVICKNLQIFRDKTTIGEIDFLIKNTKTNTVFHIELVYKYYLYIPDISTVELERWIGPNKKDSLVKKVNKLKEKQLPLLYQEETIAKLHTLGIEIDTIIQQVCFFGNLFVSRSYENISIPHINNECIVGYWIDFKEFISTTYTMSNFHMPQKQNWMVHPKFCSDWYSYDITLIKLKESRAQKKSSLLWMKTTEGVVSRFFVVWW